MTNRRDHSIEDLLLDDSFVHFCLDTDDEATETWRTWLTANPDQQPKADAARRLLFSLGIRISREEKAIEFEKLKKAIRNLQNGQAEQAIRERAAVTPLWRWIGGAAAAMLLLFTGYQMREYMSGHNEPAIGTLAYETYSTHNGERKNIQLTDGSTVMLNSNSTLKIPVTYNRENRMLDLQGEALFDVAKDPQRPFTVIADEVAVQAVGTSFKVRAYGFEPGIRTALMEGKVKVDDQRKPSEPIIMTPGQSIYIDRSSRTTQRSSFDPVEEEVWKSGALLFSNASLDEIGQKLQYWYGMEVVINAKPSSPIHFNGEFVQKELNEVLKAISYVTGLKCSVDGKRIMILSN